MRAPRRLVAAVAAAGLAGTSALVVGLTAGSASAADTRYSLFAQGDSMYYQLDGEDIPASPKNSAGSLTAQAQTDSAGQTTSFAGAPYYGKTAQTLPGTINGVPNQFGAPQLQLPFSQFPGYVTASNPTQPKADDSNYYYKVHAEAAEDGAKASGSNGAPDAIPAPNQQQVATAEVKKLSDSTLSTAEGSASGFLEGPLEVGNSVAKAQITDAGAAPKIESSVFGKFSVGGQDFGYNKSGFTYFGQSADKKAALDSANSALMAAGIQLDVAPETTTTDPTSGIITYVLGGLKVTSTFTSPTGAKYTVGYILGRVQVASVNQPVGASVASSVTHSAATMGGISPDVKASVTKSAPAIAAASPVVRSGLVKKPAAVRHTKATPASANEHLAAAMTPVTILPPVELAAVKKPTATSDEGLYVMLVLGGLSVLAAPALLTLVARDKR